MSVQTLQFIEVDSDPIHDVVLPFGSPLADALNAIVDQPEEAVCDNCKGMVGYNLLETDDGRLEHAYWHYTALILHGPEFPVVRLCEDCAAPVIQPSMTLVQQKAHEALSESLVARNLGRIAPYLNRNRA
jgi:hypothetical protein